jgi:hypothetical protein
MGVFADLAEIFNPTANPADGKMTRALTNPMATPDQKENLVSSRLATPEEMNMPEGSSGRTFNRATGQWEVKSVFQAPNPSPTFRDQLAGQAMTALNQEGIRNPLNAARAAVTPQYGGAQVDMAQTNAAQLAGVQSRNDQRGALELQRQAALGLAPSVAAIQQQQGLDAALSGQFAMANSARGGAAQRGAAQGMAQQQAGQMQQAAVNQAAALRAGEMAQARDAYGNLGGQIRAGDLGQGQLAGQMALGQAGFTQEAGIGNADRTAGMMQADQKALLGQQALDDQRALGLLGGLQNTDQMTMQGQQQTQADMLQLLGLRSGVATDNNQRQGQFVQDVAGGGAQALGWLFGGV